MKHLRTLRFIAHVARVGSLRATAEQLNITPSALTRKIRDFEDELGTAVFERLPQGMRLNAAGELLIRHIQDQESDFERLRSQISELSGIRRGHVSIACSQAFVESVVPREVSAYRAQYPQVSFSVVVRDAQLGVESLKSFEADLALLINPPPSVDVLELCRINDPLCVLIRADHPLAQSDGPVRLRECFAYPAAMPSDSLAIRAVLDAAIVTRKIGVNAPIESGSLDFLRNYVLHEQAVTFRNRSGIPRSDTRIRAREIDPRDIKSPYVVLAQLRGRALSVAAAKFADQMASALSSRGLLE